jgi:hypothetical protein
MQQVDRVANKVFGTGIALVLIAAAIHLGLITRWTIHTLSVAETRQIIATSRNIYCQVFQYNNGTRELWITLNGSRHYPDFIAPADESTLVVLAENKISYKTYVQGRDFGFGPQNRWVSLLCISVLTAGAGFVLRWAWKKERRVPVPAESRV